MGVSVHMRGLPSWSLLGEMSNQFTSYEYHMVVENRGFLPQMTMFEAKMILSHQKIGGILLSDKPMCTRSNHRPLPVIQHNRHGHLEKGPWKVRWFTSCSLHSQGEDPARRYGCHRGQWEGAGQTPRLSSHGGWWLYHGKAMVKPWKI